jgi:peptidoglycan/LPS O-acetylase OafA/YrhL
MLPELANESSVHMSTLRQLKISPLQTDLLDLSRSVAALLVVIEHLRSLMFADYLGASGMSPWGNMWYFITNFGHPAVMVFFVMSGFLVGGKCLESFAQGGFSWRKYCVDRASRLYAVYLLALVLTALLDHFGYLYLNRFGLYDFSFPGRVAAVNHNFHENANFPIFALNLAMCQTILVPVFGSNGPLWSLANEFWYYLAGPLLFALLCARSWRPIVISLFGLVLLAWFLPLEMLVYWLVWLMGAALYFFNSRRFVPLWLSLALFSVCFSAERLHLLKVPCLPDILIGISFALVINSAAANTRRLPCRNITHKAADFSYSVYLCHFPFLVFVMSGLYQVTGKGLRGPPTLFRIGLSFLILFVVYVWCYLISLLTERHTARIRKVLYRVFGWKRARPVERIPDGGVPNPRLPNALH